MGLLSKTSPQTLAWVFSLSTLSLSSKHSFNLLVGEGFDEIFLTQPVIKSTKKQESLNEEIFMNFASINLIFSSHASKVNFHLLTSMMAFVVAKKGLPKSIGI